MSKLKVLDLFSGIGGFSLGLERTGGFETVAFVEIEKFCQQVLKKHWPDVPVYDDVRKFDGVPADVICGGYPCQPFSTAGKRGGQKDDRHLWPEMYRIIKAVRPRWVIAENVAGHITMGLDAVLSDLEAANYTWWTFVIPACAVDAKHRRNRVWVVANDMRSGERLQQELSNSEDSANFDSDGKTQFVAHTLPRGRKRSSKRRPVRKSESSRSAIRQDDTDSRKPGLQMPEQKNIPTARRGQEGRATTEPCWWPPEPPVGRVAHGVPNRVDRLKGLGNAVVPQIPEIIGHAILDSLSIERKTA